MEVDGREPEELVELVKNATLELVEILVTLTARLEDVGSIPEGTAIDIEKRLSAQRRALRRDL